MKYTDFPACCTASVVLGFSDITGGAHLAGNRYGGTSIPQDLDQSNEDALRSFLRWQRREGHALVTAITNSDQVEAGRMLSKLGFRCSRALTKKHHPETTIRLWWFALDSLPT